MTMIKPFFDKYGIQILSALVATLGMMSDGMQYSWASPAVPKLLSNETTIPMTISEGEWVVQSYIIGSVVGVFFSFLTFRKLSRKYSVLASSIPITCGWIGNLAASNSTMLFVSRFIGGIGRDMAFVSVPMYLGEIADPNIRGILGTFIYIMVNIGAVISYSVTPFYPLEVSCIIGLVLSITQMVLMAFLPESPYYLLKQGDTEAARETLQILRRKTDVEEELKELTTAVERQTMETGSFKQLFTVRTNLKALAILIFLRTVQMFSGISVMAMNIHTIFSHVGGDISTNVSAIMYAAMMFISAVCTMGTMDRFGRKTLMIVSCFIASIALFLEGVYFYLKLELKINTDSVSWLPMVCVLIYVFGYRVGLGTVPIVMVSELLNVGIKVHGIAVCDIIYTSASFSANAIFFLTKSHFGIFAPFWIFGAVCFVAAILSKVFIPETRGKTLEEIQWILMGGDKEKPKEFEKSTL